MDAGLITEADFAIMKSQFLASSFEVEAAPEPLKPSLAN